MATKKTKGRGKSAVSGLVGGTSFVAGQPRKGSASGPVSRKKRPKQITEQPKPTGKEPIERTTRAKRDRARADYNTRMAADPSNPARLRPSERTPNASSKMKAVKAKMKEKYPVINNPYKVKDDEMGEDKYYVRDTSKPNNRRRVAGPRKAKKKKDSY